MVAKLKPEFDQHGVKVLGLSVDPVEDDRTWSADIEQTQAVRINFPIVSDTDRSVSNLYGMIHPNAGDTMTVRSVFIIGPDKKIKLTITYPPSTGRNFDEVLRVIDSLQRTANHKVATPVNWKNGQDCIVLPRVSNDDVKKLFPRGFTEIKPYLRTTPQPNR